jgi:5-methyltetrahydrofolate--homocysteine methyltransferase
MQHPFLSTLRSRRVLLMDGAMGTELQRAGLPDGGCCEQWNLTHPDRVLAIHRAYAQAGAGVLLTNTFQANPAALAKHGLADQLDALAQTAVRLARTAAGERRFVLGTIGPWDGSRETLLCMFRALAGVDGFLLETQSDPTHLGHLASIWTQEPPRALLASFAFCRSAQESLQTVQGLTPEAVARQAAKSGIHALGLNCGRDVGIEEAAEIIRRFRTVTDLPLFARPNAGTPTKVDGRWVYSWTPEEMAAKLQPLLEAGVAMVGGCCGTTPEHIAAFRAIVNEWNATKSACD